MSFCKEKQFYTFSALKLLQSDVVKISLRETNYKSSRHKSQAKEYNWHKFVSNEDNLLKILKN